MGTLISPKYLKKGDTIGIIAPARSIKEIEIQPFIDLVHKKGFSVISGDFLFGREGPYSASVEIRLSEIQKMIMNPEVRVIFAARGGYGSAQLLSGMDWELVRDNPKWLVGFSDITALHSAYGKFCETIHGVMPFSLMMEDAQDDASFDYLFRILLGENLKYTIPDHPMNIDGNAKGGLVGGNLSVLFSIAGTKYEPDYEGKILFLEDLDEYLYHIDRMILNFELRDIFRKIKGIIVGDFPDMHDNIISFQKQAYEIIGERAQKYNLPCLFGFPAGHKKSNFPLIFGRLNTLTVKKGANSLLMY
jgi:muramoyltetrapeptide carboxypeptidase